MRKVVFVLLLVALTSALFAVDPLKFHIGNLRASDMPHGPWLYDFDDPGLPLPQIYTDGNCFTRGAKVPAWLFGFSKLDWKDGTTTCTLQAQNLGFDPGGAVTVKLDPYILTGFGKLNTSDYSTNWTVHGEAGDRRDYTEGICHFYVDGVEKMRLLNCKIVAVSPYQTKEQIRAILSARLIPGAINWQNDVGNGGNIIVNGWGYLDEANTVEAWRNAFANSYDNQVFMDFTNATYVFGDPEGWFTFDVVVRPAFHKESVSIQDVPAGSEVDVPSPLSELETHFTTAVNGGAQSTLRGYTVNEVLAAPGGNYPLYILTPATKYWQLSTTLSTFNADITFDLTGQSLGSTASWRILHRPFYSTDWIEYPLANTQIADATHIKAMGVTSFSEWTVGSIEAELPVEMTSFTATLTAQMLVNLQWTTESETNNLGFNIYRSTNTILSGSTKMNQTVISGNNSSVTHTYNFLDPEVVVGTTYYYWVENVDMNGASHFSNYVSVAVVGADLPIIPPFSALKNAYPNPFKVNTITKIEFDVKTGETATLTIYNTRGQVVQSYTRTAGSQTISWNGQDNHGQECSAGVYFYKLSTPSCNKTKKIVVLQ